jgi:uncharacterized protein YjaG (DUF416 family)
MAKTEEKQLAFSLYMSTDMTQKEIAALAKVTEKTMGGWVRDEEWEIQKAANTVTRKQQITNYLMQLKELNDAINTRERGKRYASTAEADTINKITKAIEALEKNSTLSDYISVMEDFIKYVTAINQHDGQRMLPLVNEFIQSRAKELIG